MKVCFLLTHVPNPRINKRIEVLKDVAEIKVICARRASQNIWEPSQKVKHIIYDIDLPSSKHIIKRYIVSREFQRIAHKALLEIKPDVIYAEGLDSLIIADKYIKRNASSIIFEVADLRENYIIKPHRIIDRIVTNKLIKKEKKIFKNVDCLVVTSLKFYDLHYNQLINKENVIYAPNVPDDKPFIDYKKKSNGRFTVGFIGGIRYLRQMKMLVDVSTISDFDVLFAGAGGTTEEYDDIVNYCASKNNIFFFGKYDYNSEIASLYGKVDVVYAVYDADNPNVRIALPNKLYEAINCELPIIVAKETYLADLVNDWGIGVAVSHTKESDLMSAIDNLKNDQNYYNTLVNNCRKIKKEINDNTWKDALIKYIVS